MISRLASITVLLFLLVPISAIQQGQSGNESAVVIPRESVLPLIAFQPGCPLKIVYTETHGYLSGGLSLVLKVRNESIKPVKMYRIAYVDSKGVGGSWESAKGTFVKPSATITVSEKPATTKLLPLSDEVANRLELGREMKGVIIFMVIRVEYGDGSVYNDEKTFDALRQYLEK